MFQIGPLIYPAANVLQQNNLNSEVTLLAITYCLRSKASSRKIKSLKESLRFVIDS